MSSTNRGGVRSLLDYYRTPAQTTRAIIPHLPRPQTVLDLGCGDGAIGEIVREQYGETIEIIGIEVDEGRAAAARESLMYDDVIVRDVLAWEPTALDRRFDLTIHNPPFIHAEAFARKALACTRPCGTSAMLVRATWNVPAARREFCAAHPFDKYELESRPSFAKVKRECNKCRGTGALAGEKCKHCRGNGWLWSTNDSSDYTWNLWGPGRGGRFFPLSVEKPARRRRAA